MKSFVLDSAVAQFNGKISQSVLSWFYHLEVLSGLNDEDYSGHTANILLDEENPDRLIRLITQLDLGIDDIEVFQSPSEDFEGAIEYSVKSDHSKYNSDGQKISIEYFDLDDESAGTQKIFHLSGLLINTLTEGGTLFIDELDSRLHPLLTLTIIRLFNSKQTNPHNAQLIFTTHDTNLLSNEIFRKDQIWFTEKNRYGATDLYSLVEYKIPENASFEQDYIAGKYGAIPFIGDPSRLIGRANVKS